MRIWSLHPRYLDAKGLVALWREALLAKHVLEGKTKGYTQHPQLNRFKELAKPLDAINIYLKFVFDEASSRGYQFDHKKFTTGHRPQKLTVTQGQLDYEIKHLQAKLKQRDPARYKENHKAGHYDAHPLFTVIEGDIENWEIV